MKSAVIISAAPETDIEYITRLCDELSCKIVICADGGIKKADELELEVDLFMGDMDSADMPIDVKAYTLPVEKNFSDTEACVLKAISLGCSHIYLTGATGGRLDHMLCNLHLLETIEKSGGRGFLINDTNVIQMARNGKYTLPQGMKYFSILPIDIKLEGITITGAKYPLKNAFCDRGSTLTLSNEPIGEFEIEIKRGEAFLIFSRD